MIFILSKHILPKEIPEDSDFIGLNSAVASDGKETVHVIISHLYKSNTKIRQKRQLGPYHKFDPIGFWFVNTVGYQRRLILTYSMQASIFNISCPFDSYDNCIYNDNRNGDVPVYDIYDITEKQSIRYFDSKD